MRVPERIELERDTRTLVLHWADASPRRIAYRALREACACAACRRRRIDGNVSDAAEDIVVTEVRPMGYGIQVVFSDGHDRGIFPWPFLEAAFSGNAAVLR
jgi:DUF971 family protein